MNTNDFDKWKCAQCHSTWATVDLGNPNYWYRLKREAPESVPYEPEWTELLFCSTWCMFAWFDDRV